MESLKTTHHPRESELGQWIYPVNSRRSGGISLGINLNMDKLCSFDCPYCQVDRLIPASKENPPIDQLLWEVESFLIQYQQTGHLSGQAIQDIALAGDGEPTLYPDLPQLLNQLVLMKQKYKVPKKLVLFTNGTSLNRKDLADSWSSYFANQGEVWFKLDFWDQASFERANGKRYKHSQILEHLLTFGRQYPLILQCCFFRDSLDSTNLDFVHKWSQQLKMLLQEGMKLDHIQVYTLARTPKDRSLLPYSDLEMQQIGKQVRHLTGQQVNIFFSH